MNTVNGILYFIICWVIIYSYPRTCKNTCTLCTFRERAGYVYRRYFGCLKENIFWVVPEIIGSMAGREPVIECGLLAINDTCVIKWFGSFGHNEWCFIVNTSWLTCLHGPVDWAAYKYFISSVKIRSLRGVRLKTQVRSSIKIHP